MFHPLYTSESDLAFVAVFRLWPLPECPPAVLAQKGDGIAVSPEGLYVLLDPLQCQTLILLTAIFHQHGLSICTGTDCVSVPARLLPVQRRITSCAGKDCHLYRHGLQSWHAQTAKNSGKDFVLFWYGLPFLLVGITSYFCRDYLNLLYWNALMFVLTTILRMDYNLISIP